MVCALYAAVPKLFLEISVTLPDILLQTSIFFLKLQLMFFILFSIYYECIERSGDSIVRNIWILEKFEFLECFVVFQKFEFLGCILVWKLFSLSLSFFFGLID